MARSNKGRGSIRGGGRTSQGGRFAGRMPGRHSGRNPGRQQEQIPRRNGDDDLATVVGDLAHTIITQ